MERVLLRQLREELLSDEAFEALVAEVQRLLDESKLNPKPLERELTKVRKESENIMAAIRQGIITPSTKQALEAAEARIGEIEKELAAMRHSKPRQVIPQLRRRWEELVETFGQDETPEDMQKAQRALRDPYGEITLFPSENGHLEAEIKKGHLSAALSEMALVAGAGFEPTTFGL